jgi:phospholipase C
VALRIVGNHGRMRRFSRRSAVSLAGVWLVAASLLAACSTGPPARLVSGGPTGSYLVPAGIHKIKHVIIVMQENRSFDSYFGTYPGADGIPMRRGVPAVCVPDPEAAAPVPIMTAPTSMAAARTAR